MASGVPPVAVGPKFKQNTLEHSIQGEFFPVFKAFQMFLNWILHLFTRAKEQNLENSMMCISH